MDCWRRLEDAHLVFVRGCDFACVCGAIEAADPDVVVDGARDDLDAFEGARQDHDVAAGRVCLRTNTWLQAAFPSSQSKQTIDMQMIGKTNSGSLWY